MNVIRHRPRGLLLALICSFALVTPVGAAAQVTSDSTGEVEALVDAIRSHRDAAWHWQRVMGKRPTRTQFLERQTTDVVRLTYLRDTWRTRAMRLRDRALRPPHRAQWLCIHRHEGRWKDPNAPYYGGLQMDLGFQRAYGRYLLRRKGTANRWSPAEQMWTAEKALRDGRGFHPWPVSARRCGLL